MLKSPPTPPPVALEIEGATKHYESKIQRAVRALTERDVWPDDPVPTIRVEVHDTTPNEPRQPLEETGWHEATDGDWRARLQTVLQRAAGGEGRVWIKPWSESGGGARHYWR